MTTTEMLDHLNACGNLQVPCSRYGTDTETCAVVAASVALIYADATGDPVTTDSLDHIMGLVVNDHDDIEYLLDNYDLPTEGDVAL